MELTESGGSNCTAGESMAQSKGVKFRADPANSPSGETMNRGLPCVYAHAKPKEACTQNMHVNDLVVNVRLGDYENTKITQHALTY